MKNVHFYQHLGSTCNQWKWTCWAYPDFYLVCTGQGQGPSSHNWNFPWFLHSCTVVIVIYKIPMNLYLHWAYKNTIKLLGRKKKCVIWIISMPSDEDKWTVWYQMPYDMPNKSWFRYSPDTRHHMGLACITSILIIGQNSVVHIWTEHHMQHCGLLIYCKRRNKRPGVY